MLHPQADSVLNDQGEAEWRRLLSQLDLAQGFWLGFVFSASPRSVNVLRERTAEQLRSQGRRMFVHRPAEPEGLGEVLRVLLTSREAAEAGCAWVEAIRSDVPGASAQPWTAAWDNLFLRGNERRDALRSPSPRSSRGCATPPRTSGRCARWCSTCRARLARP